MRIHELENHKNQWGNNLSAEWERRYVIGHVPNRYEWKDGDEFRL